MESNRAGRKCRFCFGARVAFAMSLGLALPMLSDSSLAQQTPAIVGRWEPPPRIIVPGSPPTLLVEYCWPYETVHLIHLATGKALLYYSPGCVHPIDPHPYHNPLAELFNCPAGTSGDERPRIWNPVDGQFTNVPYPGEPAAQLLYDCNGNSALADGRIVIAGGGCGPQNADARTLIFNPFPDPFGSNPNGTWSVTGSMSYKRWYPTATTLGSGKILVAGGSGCPVSLELPQCPLSHCLCGVVPLEIFDPDTGQWTLLPPSYNLPGVTTTSPLYYPFLFVVPDFVSNNGKVFLAGPGGAVNAQTVQTWVLNLDVTDLEQWQPVGDHGPQLIGLHGSAVMYEPGKVLKCGGYNPLDCTYHCEAFKNTATIDLSNGSGDWVSTPQMDLVSGRKDHNLVLLLDGSVLAVGGQNFCHFNDSDDCPPIPPAPPDPNPCAYGQCGCCIPVLFAERFDPEMGTWTQMAEATRPRGYHSTALLLANGRVLSCGGENDNFCSPADIDWNCPYHSSRSAEIYEPKYIFVSDGQGGSLPALRPVIASAPQIIHYGSIFNVTPDESSLPAPATISKVSLLKLGAVTHGFDQDQRFVPLRFCDHGQGFLEVGAPPHPSVAPPGFYKLSIVNDSGVPSEAVYVKLELSCYADLNHDCVVDRQDLAILVSQMGTCTCPCEADLNGDGAVNGKDAAILGSHYSNIPCQYCPESPPGGGGGSMMMAGGGGASMMMAGGAIDDWTPDQATIDWLMTADDMQVLGWYLATFGAPLGSDQ